MKKALMASVLSIFLGVGVLFGGCGNNTISNDLSEINIQITELQQQITSLTQTILELQTELQNAKGDISSLQSQLAIASANYDKLYNQVYGEQNSYYNIGETFSYSISGIKLFDLTLESATYGLTSRFHYINYTFYSYVSGLTSLDNENLNLSILFYDYTTNQTYEVSRITEQIITFTLDIPDETRVGLIYLYQGGTIASIFEVNFDELSS